MRLAEPTKGTTVFSSQKQLLYFKGMLFFKRIVFHVELYYIGHKEMQ